jgi:uncharacterized protein
MGKLALLVIAVIAALLWFRYKAGAEARRARASSSAQSSPERPQVQRMVQCANCGIHLPSGEAFLDTQGEAYCSHAHRDAGKSVS